MASGGRRPHLLNTLQSGIIHTNGQNLSRNLEWGCVITKYKYSKKYVFVGFCFFTLDMTVYFTFVSVACFCLRLEKGLTQHQ